MEINEHRILVVGLGLSGAAAARALRLRDKQVTVCDAKTPDELGPVVEELRQLKVDVYTGGYPPVTRENTDLIVASPGVPRTTLPLVQAEELGIPIWSELELAFRFSPAKFIGITGEHSNVFTFLRA